MKIKIYNKIQQRKNPNFLDGVIIPKQAHSNNIVEIITGKEDLTNCDGVFTSKKNNFKLAVKTADCAAIVFEDKQYYGILHAGWRGAVNGIIEKMLQKFEDPTIFVAPFYKKFEIQKDFCYDAISKKFGNKFFIESDNKIFFDFEGALKSILGKKAVFSKTDTFFDESFYSWRKEKTDKRNYILVYK